MNELRKQLTIDFQDQEYAHAYLEENSNMRIAAQIRALRLRNGWLQEDLANAAKMRQERISKIEGADFDSLTLKTLRRLAQAFDVHLSVKFESVYDAVNDFIELSKERLVCDQRPKSLDKLQNQSRVNDSFSSRSTGLISIPVGSTTANTATPRLKIEA